MNSPSASKPKRFVRWARRALLIFSALVCGLIAAAYFIRPDAANRRKRRSQLQAIVQVLDRQRISAPLVIGGDFNAPPGDAVFRLLGPLARDAFATVGRGWGNTIVNDIPFLRIDQLWLGEDLIPLDAVAVKTKHSDHRAVICDLRFAN